MIQEGGQGGLRGSGGLEGDQVHEEFKGLGGVEVQWSGRGLVVWEGVNGFRRGLEI